MAPGSLPARHRQGYAKPGQPVLFRYGYWFSARVPWRPDLVDFLPEGWVYENAIKHSLCERSSRPTNQQSIAEFDASGRHPMKNRVGPCEPRPFRRNFHADGLIWPGIITGHPMHQKTAAATGKVGKAMGWRNLSELKHAVHDVPWCRVSTASKHPGKPNQHMSVEQHRDAAGLV